MRKMKEHEGVAQAFAAIRWTLPGVLTSLSLLPVNPATTPAAFFRVVLE